VHLVINLWIVIIVMIVFSLDTWFLLINSEASIFFSSVFDIQLIKNNFYRRIFEWSWPLILNYFDGIVCQKSLSQRFWVNHGISKLFVKLILQLLCFIHLFFKYWENLLRLIEWDKDIILKYWFLFLPIRIYIK
jgi:hypothetical protein